MNTKRSIAPRNTRTKNHTIVRSDDLTDNCGTGLPVDACFVPVLCIRSDYPFHVLHFFLNCAVGSLLKFYSNIYM